MDLSYRDIDKFKVMDVTGKFGSNDVDAFESALRSLVDQGNIYVVINLMGIKRVPGRVVSVFRTVWKKMVDMEGSICAIAQEQKVCEALLESGINMLMPVYSSEELFTKEIQKDKGDLVHLRAHERAGYTVIEVSQPISIFSGYYELDSLLNALLWDKKTQVALNFSSGEYFYSEVVGLMNKWSWKLKKEGGGLCLVGVSPEKKEQLKLMGFDWFVRICEKEEELEEKE